MSKNFVIRSEKEEDYKKTEHMVMRAFWNIHGPGCNEHLLVRIIRNSKDYLPQFSRVVELDGEIVGAIFYTRAKVVDGDKVHEIVTFGPLAIEPTMQNEGIGRMLLEETFSLVKQAGYPGICIYGEPQYYPKRGFKTCDHFGITDPEGKNFDALMAYALDEEAFSKIHGKLYESPDFDACNDIEAIKKMDAEFPAYPKVKIKEGFLQIYDKHFGVVKAVKGHYYTVKFWELTLPAVLNEERFSGDAELPKEGDVVLFNFLKDKASVIDSVCNLMEE